ncbi:hypothetical protein AFB00_30545 (plasmid) [Pseudonocardia sp. HH130630-07]|nr:hypothetical protein AFB00_30545 [Pseudonocardia sp. HH130630-07]
MLSPPSSNRSSVGSDWIRRKRGAFGFWSMSSLATVIFSLFSAATSSRIRLYAWHGPHQFAESVFEKIRL